MLRSLEPLPRPERGRVELDGFLVRGVVHWPHDAVYRPTIGMFVGGALRRTAPTFRRPAPLYGEWACAFQCDLEDLRNDLGRVRLVCLETGALVHSFRDPEKRADPVEPQPVPVEEIIAMADDARAPRRCDGFPSFLDLSAADQIDLLYFCVLGRAADPGGLASYRRRIREGDGTILDVRDHLLASEEFNLGARPNVSSNFMHWIVWGGLGEALPRFALRNDSAGDSGLRSAVEVGSLEDVVEPSDLGAYLAKVALGGHAAADHVSQWQKDHSALVAEVTREIERRRDIRPKGEDTRRTGSSRP